MAHTWAGWERDVLRLGGWPDNDCNHIFLDAWAKFEGGAAENNPLNTARDCCGGTPLAGNPDGVKNYPTPQQGAQATVGALTNGFYPTIVALLAAGKACNVFLINPSPDLITGAEIAAVRNEVMTWGSKDFAKTIGPKVDPGLPIIGVSPSGGILGLGATAIEGILAGINDAGDMLGAIKTFLVFIAWLLDPVHILRLVEITLGVIFIVLGLGALFRVFTASALDEAAQPAPVRAIARAVR